VDFQLKVQSEDIEIDLDFIMPISEIELFDNKEKHTHLFNTLCEIIDDNQLDTISNADNYYGYNSKECFEVLKQIQQTQTIPKKIDYAMSEVLSLTRYQVSETTKGHQERIFASVIILLGDYEYTAFENYKYTLISIFISVKILDDIDLFKQTKALFYYKLHHSKNIEEVIFLAYLISGIHLLLKEENDYKKIFDFLNRMEILKQTDYENDTSFTAKIVKELSVIMLENIDFIIDSDLKSKAKKLIKSMILLCKERFDKQAKETYLKRIFTQEEQQRAIELLPKLVNKSFDKVELLVKNCFNEKQVELIRRSVFNAEIYKENYEYNYEVELNQNIFFDEVLKLLGKRLTEESME